MLRSVILFPNLKFTASYAVAAIFLFYSVFSWIFCKVVWSLSYAVAQLEQILAKYFWLPEAQQLDAKNVPVRARLKLFFCKTIYSFHKTGHKTIQKTNHYILLTNVSIKRCIKTSFETYLIRGGKSSSQTSTLQTESSVYPSRSFLQLDYVLAK